MSRSSNLATMLAPAADTRTDLLHRAGGGTEVTLFWQRTTGTLTVQVVDHNTNRVQEFDVPPHRARHAFDHPAVYGFSIPALDEVLRPGRMTRLLRAVNPRQVFRPTPRYGQAA
jgi:hypothetical protein